MSLSTKIDFAVILRVNHANPNGDPLNGNRPRTDYGNYGEITDVCLKRKIRDRLQEGGANIFVQSDDRRIDNAISLKARAFSAETGLGAAAFVFKTSTKAKKSKAKDSDAPDEQFAAIAETKKKEGTALLACQKWFDVRAFGQLFAFASSKEEGDKADSQRDEETKAKPETKGSGVSIPIRGPVTVQSAFSVEPVDITSTQITKSVSGEGDGTKRGADTMGMKHRVDKAVYVFFGSMNPQLAVRTGFSDADAEAIKAVLPRLFENDASSARPEGSMAVVKLLWWKHNCAAGQYSSARVHGTLHVNPGGDYTLNNLDGLSPEEIDGF